MRPLSQARRPVELYEVAGDRKARRAAVIRPRRYVTVREPSGLPPHCGARSRVSIRRRAAGCCGDGLSPGVLTPFLSVRDGRQSPSVRLSVCGLHEGSDDPKQREEDSEEEHPAMSVSERPDAEPDEEDD